jgi:hypothetical protein
MGTRGSFPGGKAAGRKANHSPPSSAEVKECVELYLHSPSTPSWRGAKLKHGNNFTFTLFVWSNGQNVTGTTQLHLVPSSRITSVLMTVIICEGRQKFGIFGQGLGTVHTGHELATTCCVNLHPACSTARSRYRILHSGRSGCL